MVSLVIDKKVNDLFHFGGILKTGSLSVFDYPNFEYEYDDVESNYGTTSSYTFPYGPSSGSFAGGSTKTLGWSVGGFVSLNRSLSRNDKDWFFVRFDLEHFRLKDQYDFIWSQVEYVGLDKQEILISDKGDYIYHAISFATRAGYQRFLDKKNRLFAQANLGVCYYHPYYVDSKGQGYWTGTPFMGVEFEAGAGIGYVIKRK